jgi:hypothetical protein
MNPENIKYKIWFFGGGEARDNKFNLFTGSFIRLMKEIMGDEFDFIKGIYFSSNMINVIWTLNNCQRPLKNPDKQRLINIAATQILTEGYAAGSGWFKHRKHSRSSDGCLPGSAE